MFAEPLELQKSISVVAVRYNSSPKLKKKIAAVEAAFSVGVAGDKKKKKKQRS